MCGRVNVSNLAAIQLLLEFLDIRSCSTKPSERYNISPSSELLAISTSRKTKIASSMQWGFFPRRSSTFMSRAIINARSETIWEKPSFRDLMNSQRCIIPVNAFYEWDRKYEKKIPYSISPSHEKVFALAGIYQSDSRGNKHCCIITTDANSPLSKVHHRMPVILNNDSLEDWLFSADRSQLNRLMQSCEDDLIQIDRVSEYVNNAVNDGPECMRKSDGKEKYVKQDENQVGFEF